MIRFIHTLGWLLLVVLAVSCTRPKAAPETGKLRVVATIAPLADWARQVGGEHVEVTTLLSAGSSPHTFEPTPAELEKVAKASVFLKIGLKLDDWAADMQNAAQNKIMVLSFGDDLLQTGKLPDVDHVLEVNAPKEDDSRKHEHDHSGRNPHFWLDPTLVAQCVTRLAEVLGKADPQHNNDYSANAQKYANKLHDLDTEISSSLALCKNRSFVTFHNGFPYFARRYGLDLAGVIEEYPGKDPSDKYLKELTTRLRTMGIRTVFCEPQLNPRVAQVIASEIGAEVKYLDYIGSENLPDRNTYVNLMRYNAARMHEALSK